MMACGGRRIQTKKESPLQYALKVSKVLDKYYNRSNEREDIVVVGVSGRQHKVSLFAEKI